MEFKIGNCRVSVSLLFVCLLCLILFVDSTGIMLFGLLSVAIHESGHLIFMIITKKYPETVSFQLGGIIIKSRGFTDYNCEFLVALGGCMFNFAAFLISAIIYYLTANDMAMIFSASNLGLLIFNLIPVNGLDGMDLIRLKILKFKTIEQTDRICFIISISFLTVSMILSVYLVFYNKLNPTIIICFIYLIVLTLLNIKNISK